MPILDDDVGHYMVQLNRTSAAALHCFRVCNNIISNDTALGYWIKSRSTTCFSRFVLEVYNDDRWSLFFRITEDFVLQLSNQLRPYVQKNNATCCLAIPTLFRVACTLFKLAQDSSMTLWLELFAMGVSIVSSVIHKTCHAINIVLRHEIL